MKRAIAVLLGVLALATGLTVQAQVVMDMKLSRRNYLLYEPIEVTIRMRNNSAQVLVFGEDPRLRGVLAFDIVGPKREPVGLVQKNQSLAGLVLRAGETKELKVRLNHYFRLEKSGIYRVHAYVSHPALEEEFQSPDVIFEITGGALIWSAKVGVPDLLNQNEATTQRVKTRTYKILSLQEATEKFYYLMLEDTKNVYALHCLGQTVIENKMQFEVDMLSSLHILFPLTNKLFRYYSYDIDGNMIENSIYRAVGTAPTLFHDPVSGEVKVLGGEHVQEMLERELEIPSADEHEETDSMDALNGNNQANITGDLSDTPDRSPEITTPKTEP